MQFDLKKLETFDRKTEKQYKLTSAAIKLDLAGLRIRMNMAAVDLLKLKTQKKDMRIKFFRFNKAWYLALTSETDGYAIALENKQRAGATIGAAIVLQQMRKNDPHNREYFLMETEHELAGEKLYELLPKTTEVSK